MPDNEFIVTINEKKYKDSIPGNEKELFKLIYKWKKYCVFVDSKNAYKIKEILMDPIYTEVYGTIHSSIGKLQVYFRSQTHICNPFQLHMYALKYKNFTEYAKSRKKREKNDQSNECYVSTISRDIRDLLSLLGVKHATFMHGRMYMMTESVECLFNYLLDAKSSLKSYLDATDDIPLYEATCIYNLLVDAFNSVPPLVDYHVPFDAEGELYIDWGEMEVRDKILAAFCEKTGVLPYRLRKFEAPSEFVVELIKGITGNDSDLGRKWKSLTSKDQAYIKFCLQQKYKHMGRELKEYGKSLIEQQYDPPEPPTDIIWLTKKT